VSAYPKDEGNYQPQAGHAFMSKKRIGMIPNGDTKDNAEKACPAAVE